MNIRLMTKAQVSCWNARNYIREYHILRAEIKFKDDVQAVTSSFYFSRVLHT